METDVPHATTEAVAADVTQAAFFERLYAGCAGAVQFLALWPDGGPRELFFVRQPRDWADAMRWAREKSETGRNVYFAVATQPPDATRDRTKATAYELPALFHDLDLGDDTEAVHEAAWAKLDATGLITHANSSGYGLHLFARFPEPIRVPAGRRAFLEDSLFAFGAWINHLVHGSVGRVDRFDLASVLRVPGTLNHPDARKRAKGRVTAKTAVYAASDRIVPLAAFSELVVRYPRPGPHPSTGEVGEVDAKPGVLPAEWDAWLANDAWLRGYFHRERPGLAQTDTSASGYLMSLMNRLARKYGKRVTDAESRAIGVKFYQEAGEPARLHAIRRTWQRVKAGAATRP